MTAHITSDTSITPKKIRVIGVPLDLGQSRRGVDMGPSAVRVAGLEARLEELGHVVEDAGNISVAIAEQKKEGDPHAKYLKEITATCTKHADLVLKTLESGKVPLVLGGHKYSGKFSQRKRARHAPGSDDGIGASGTG